jgi:nitrite reductase (NAD(P)H)
MNDPDLSTKLKLMGVDVASFGDYFADERMLKEAEAAEAIAAAAAEEGVQISSSKPSRKRKGPRDTKNDPIKCLTYHDPFSSTYKKFIFDKSGEYLLG